MFEKMEETDFKKIMEAVKIINDGGKAIITLQINYENLKEKVEKEITDRENDTGEIKTNYITRFDKIEKMIKDTNKIIIGFCTSVIGIVVFTIIAKIINWI